MSIINIEYYLCVTTLNNIWSIEMLNKLMKYRMICFYTKPAEAWITFCLVVSFISAYLMVNVNYGFFTLLALSFSIFLVLAYQIIAPIYGFCSALQIKWHYGPKTLKAVVELINSHHKVETLNIEQLASENGEYQG